MRNAEAKVCRAAGPRREAPWGAGGWRSVRCATRMVQPCSMWFKIVQGLKVHGKKRVRENERS